MPDDVNGSDRALTTKEIALRVEGKVDTLVTQVAALTVLQGVAGKHLEDHEVRIRAVEGSTLSLSLSETKSWTFKERAVAFVLAIVAISTFLINLLPGIGA